MRSALFLLLLPLLAGCSAGRGRVHTTYTPEPAPIASHATHRPDKYTSLREACTALADMIENGEELPSWVMPDAARSIRNMGSTDRAILIRGLREELFLIYPNVLLLYGEYPVSLANTLNVLTGNIEVIWVWAPDRFKLDSVSPIPASKSHHWNGRMLRIEPRDIMPLDD